MAKTKCYVLDTNIVMRNPEVLNGFAENEVVLPEIVQRELDHLKNAPGQKGYEARQAVNAIDAFYTRRDGDPVNGWKTSGGGLFRIEMRFDEAFMSAYAVDEIDRADNRIIAVAKMLADENGAKKPTRLISGDKIMRQLARNAGLVAEGYRNDEVKNVDFDYTGWTELEADDILLLNQIYDKSECEIDLQDESLDENEYAILRCGSASVLVRYRNRVLYKIRNFDKKPVYDVQPLNARQSFQMDACTADPNDIPCVIVKGAAGTGKTYIAEACALEGLYRGQYEHIIITRSMVNPDGEGELGTLPGDSREKMDPYLKPFYDNLEQLMRHSEPNEDIDQIRIAVEDLLLRGDIEIQPMSSIRGRTFTNCYIIIDEAQNTSAKQIETLITRIGEGCKIVILGDLNQIDTSKLSRYSNGLAVSSERMRGSQLVAQIEYLDTDVKRSPLAKEAVDRFRMTDQVYVKDPGTTINIVAAESGSGKSSGNGNSRSRKKNASTRTAN